MFKYMKTAAVAVFMSVIASMAYAVPADYKIEVINQPVKAGKAATFDVAITKDGKPVTGAIIIDKKLHMDMGSIDMPADVSMLAPDTSGHIRFTGDLTMYGEWTIDLAVTVPEEKEPLKANVKFKVVK